MYPSWESDWSVMDINMAGIITADVIDNDVVLSYVDSNLGDVTSVQIPGLVGAKNFEVHMFDNGLFRIISVEPDGSYTDPSDLIYIESVKVITIESTNTTTTSGNGKNTSPQQAIYNELKSAGVDINNCL